MKTVRPGGPQVLSATSLIGDDVVNPQGEDIGKVKELMIDLDEGRVAYAVLSFGGVMGFGDKLFAIPWDAFRLDTDRKAFILNVPKSKLENAPGFDKDHWPMTEDSTYITEVYTYYGYEPYWE